MFAKAPMLVPEGGSAATTFICGIAVDDTFYGPIRSCGCKLQAGSTTLTCHQEAVEGDRLRLEQSAKL